MSDDLLTWDPHGVEAWEGARGEAPRVLVHTLRGFIDAGHAGTVLGRHVLDQCEPVRVASFDIDRLLDYRSRRPEMVFSVNEWTEYDEPHLVVDLVRDAGGRAFLLLQGQEPDVLWEAYISAVRTLVERLGVNLVVGVSGIPMAAPHTRPVQATIHGTRSDLLPPSPSLLGTMTIPASAMNLLEYRFGKWGLDALSIAVHVPHYLSPSTYPQAAQRAMELLKDLTGLDGGPAALDEAAQRAMEEIEQQVEASEEVQELVRALERQYDDLLESRQGVMPLDGRLPTAEEIGAEFEKYLADRGKGVL
ncbi:MAG: PAC2 family protein [Demequinaceae bacterium]|nr:PAC2 family protein [Demequinaceae bacterium]